MPKPAAAAMHKPTAVTIHEATNFFAFSITGGFLTISYHPEGRPVRRAGCPRMPFFSLACRSAYRFDRRLTAANQNPSASTNNHSPGASNAALAVFRRAVDVAVILGFRSTPRNGSGFSLLLPRMACQGDGVHDARPISATRENASAELALQRSTVQHSNDQPADAERVPREIFMQVRLSFSASSSHSPSCLIGCRAPQTVFEVFVPSSSFPSSQSHGLRACR
jgi:hypothetical protein